jgi:hypothetical protein
METQWNAVLNFSLLRCALACAAVRVRGDVVQCTKGETTVYGERKRKTEDGREETKGGRERLGDLSVLEERVELGTIDLDAAVLLVLYEQRRSAR